MNINKLEDYSKVNGTWFNGEIVVTSFNKLTNVFGNDVGDLCDDGKTTHEWRLELEDGTPFTLYDWKEYRNIANDEVIAWHIGARSKSDAIKAKRAVEEALKNPPVYLVVMEYVVDGENSVDMIVFSDIEKAQTEFAAQKDNVMTSGHFSDAKLYINGKLDDYDCPYEWDISAEYFCIWDKYDDFSTTIKLMKKEVK